MDMVPDPKNYKIGGRDSPHGVFDPWVRWDLGLDRIRSFRDVVVVVVSPPSKSLKCKNGFVMMKHT